MRNTGRDGEMQLHTMLEKDMLLWKSFSSLENILRVESGTKSNTVEYDSTFYTFSQHPDYSTTVKGQWTC